MSSFNFRIQRPVLLVAIVLFVVLARWSILNLQSEVDSTVRDSPEPIQEQPHADVSISRIHEHDEKIDLDVQVEHDTKLTHNEKAHEIKIDLNRDLHLNLHKSTRHFKQLPLPDVDLDELREKEPHHYPPWNDYKNRDYDPNRWHFFPLSVLPCPKGIVTVRNTDRNQRDERFYQCSIYETPDSPDNKPEPYRPEVASGDFVPCVGPRGQRLNESEADWVFAHKNRCSGACSVLNHHHIRYRRLLR